MAFQNQAYQNDTGTSSPETSGDEMDTDRSSMASYRYIRAVEEKKKWDKFTSNEAEASSASEAHTDLIKKASVCLKMMTIFICFSVVLGAGVVAKGALFFMLAQVQNNTVNGRNVIYCNNQEGFVTKTESTSVAWLW